SGFRAVTAQIGTRASAGLLLAGLLGCTALAAAPGVRVISLSASWARARDYKYAAASAALVLLIVTSVIGTAIWR
ncbi:MAG: DUF1634 domain-containing protein, partial [Actinobacteria bacterium]|nr:DUF1634 domain-containing protein [Actinomycetota bacterium]